MTKLIINVYIIYITIQRNPKNKVKFIVFTKNIKIWHTKNMIYKKNQNILCAMLCDDINPLEEREKKLYLVRTIKNINDRVTLIRLANAIGYFNTDDKSFTDIRTILLKSINRPRIPNIPNKYTPINLLGSGFQGQVYKVIRKFDNKTIALKIGTYTKATQNEIDFLEKIYKSKCNIYVPRYYSHFIDREGYYFIEMEFIDGIIMRKYCDKLRFHQKSMMYRHSLLIIKDIALALVCIHSLGIIHNDVKSDNIIIDRQLVPKLIDYGMSSFIDDEKYSALGKKRTKEWILLI